MSKLLQVYEHEGLRVTFDARRCIHAAECIRSLPQVFDSQARPWIRPEAAPREDVIAAVQKCPTGALHAAVDGDEVHLAPGDVSIRVRRNGPLFVRGSIHVTGIDGEEILTDERCALCRCGQSKRKPFCDGSHQESGFRDPV
ncbi:MAG: (4Fe-4S)-binding protein [Gemmatimonas sp.]